MTPLHGIACFYDVGFGARAVSRKTPIYFIRSLDSNEFEGALYFSSNRNNGQGGFDIYKTKGRLNLWEPPTNVHLLNSKKDEMYISFYNERKGYFSSNRSEALSDADEFCCNDVFSFELEKPEVEQLINIRFLSQYLPLKLYFHNDEPDCCTMNTSTEKTYKLRIAA